MAELGVHLETCANEASAAAMLGASINYPLRGAVTWKSIVGTNVAADALSNLSSPGVIGGAMIIIGEDYGEGASVIQERSYAYALKSSMWLLDPRPDLPSIVRIVEKGFELSEASHAPVMLELRIRACHATGEFAAKDNRKGVVSGLDKLAGPPRFNYARLSHPPVTFTQEKLKVEERLPAARAFIREHKLNETIAGDLDDIGIIVMGGLTNSVLRALERMGLADVFGASRVPLLVLNVVYPLVPEEIREFCAGKRAVLVVEEGHPDYIEQAVNVELRRADMQTRVLGKGPLPQAGEYTSDVLLEGLAAFLQAARPNGLDADGVAEKARGLIAHKAKAAAALGPLPPRPPAFCTGCPERPVFSAIKLMQRELGPTHISTDIGCHSFATFAPFSLGNSILGYGMSLASAAAVTPNMEKRPIAIMGDGGFWHNGLITGVASNLFNKGDGVLIVMQNGYASATGQQYIPSSVTSRDGPTPGVDIEQTLRIMGVKWLRTVRSYSVAVMAKTLKEAMRTAERGLKVIIADGECQLARQRRVRAEDAVKLERGMRVTRTRYGVDDEICTGDHSCIRLSGCPSLTVKPSTDPLRSDPVATVIDSCVGCGLCGEVAHAAVLCPSFYRAEIIRNATWRDRVLFWWRRKVIGWLGGDIATPSARATPLPNPPSQGAAGVVRQALRRETRRPPHHTPDRRARRRRRRRADRLDRDGGGRGRLPGAEHVDPRRRATHRRHHLLHRDFPGRHARARRQAPGAGAHARRRRHRHRGGERIAGSRPHGGERLRHARAHASHRLDQPLLCHGREDRHGRRPLRPGQADQDRHRQCARHAAHRHGRARQTKRLDHQRGDARRHRRLGAAAADGRATRSGDPRRRQIGRQQPARLPRRARGRARESAPAKAPRKNATPRPRPNCSSMRSPTRCPRWRSRPRSKAYAG